MRQTSTLTRQLTEAQERHARGSVITGNATYRLYFEDTGNTEHPAEPITRLISRFFHGFTSWFATGYWNGQPEFSRIVEIIAPRRDHQRIRQLADALRRATNQSAVLVTCSDTVMELVTDETRI